MKPNVRQLVIPSVKTREHLLINIFIGGVANYSGITEGINAAEPKPENSHPNTSLNSDIAQRETREWETENAMFEPQKSDDNTNNSVAPKALAASLSNQRTIPDVEHGNSNGEVSQETTRLCTPLTTNSSQMARDKSNSVETQTPPQLGTSPALFWNYRENTIFSLLPGPYHKK